MEKTIIKTLTHSIEYIVPATLIVLVQIYYRKTWLGRIQFFSLFFGSILSGVLFSDFIRIVLEITNPELMAQYGERLDHFIIGFAVIAGFYLLLFLFAKEEFFNILKYLRKGK